MCPMTYSVVIMLSLMVAIGISVILSHAVKLLDVMLHTTFPIGILNGQIISPFFFLMIIFTKQIYEINSEHGHV